MKIAVRIFKSNIKKLLPCFMSSILVSATLLLFEGIKVMFLSGMSEKEIRDSSLGNAVHLYIYVLLFISVILILYTVNQYSRIRIRDYGMFMVLGSEKKDILWMVLTEYGLISMISYATGCIFGTVFLLSVRGAVLSEGFCVELSGEMYLKAVLKTFACMLAVYGAAVFMNVISLQSNSLASLMKYDKKKTVFPSVRAGLTGTVCAAACFVIAAVILGNENIAPYIKMKYGLLLVLAGIFLCFTYMGTLLLYLLRNRERWYYRHLLKIKDMYYRFSDHKNIMLLSFVINFAVLVFVNVNIVSYGNATSMYMWKYPYDYVYVAEETQADRLLQELRNEEGQTGGYPCMLLSCMEGGQYVAMPLSAFNSLSGKEEELRQGEIIAVLQKHDEDEDVLFRSGRACFDTEGGAKWFEVRKEMKEVLFVAQQPESIGVVVLNESDYGSMEKIWGGRTLITWIQRENGRDVEAHMKDRAEAFGAALFYSKEELMRRDRKEDIISLIFYICMGIYLITGNMAVLAVRVWSVIPSLSGKYGFLGKLGMDEEDIKAHVKSELSMCMKIPFVMSFVLGMGVLLLILGGGDGGLNRQVFLMFAVLILMQALYIAGMEGYGYHLVKDRLNGNEVRLWS